MKTALIYSKEQALIFLRDRPRAERLYPLTPNAMATVKRRISIPLLSPLDIFTDYRHLRILATVRRWEKILKPIVKKKDLLEDVGWEVFKNTFHIFATTVKYLEELIRGTGPWILHDSKKWISTNDHSVAVELLFLHVWKNSESALGRRPPKSQWGKGLINLINWFIIKFCVKKQSLWITGYAYNFKSLSNEINTSNEKLSILYPGVADRLSLLRILHVLACQYLPFLSARSALEIVPVTSERVDKKSSLRDVLEIAQIFKSKQIIKTCADFIGNHVSYSESLVPGLTKLIRNTTPSYV